MHKTVLMVNLIGLRFTDDENTNEWEKRKLEYTPALALPIKFQDFLEGDFTNKYSFLYALHPENINKEILSVMGSAHIFVDRKQIKQKLNSALQKWFYQQKQSMNSQDKQSSSQNIRQQQQQFFKQQGPDNSKRPAIKSRGEVDPYSLDIAPMNIFENQVIPTGIHNISKNFRPNLATIRVLSLGMKFIPKTQSLMWKRNFSNFEDFRRRMNNKMFFFVEKTPGTFIRDKTFRIKNTWNCMEEYRNVNKFCFDVRDRLDEVFQKTMGMNRSQNMSNKEKTALKSLQRNKNIAVVVNDTDKMSALYALTKKMSLKKAKDNSMKNEFTTNLLKKKQISLLE